MDVGAAYGSCHKMVLSFYYPSNKAGINPFLDNKSYSEKGLGTNYKTNIFKVEVGESSSRGEWLVTVDSGEWPVTVLIEVASGVAVSSVVGSAAGYFHDSIAGARDLDYQFPISLLV